MNWQVQHSSDGYTIRDNEGSIRGRYKSANDLATHLALALAEVDRLNAQITHDQFFAHLERASALVASWPEWKRNILADSGQPTVKTPRTPIVRCD